MARFYQTAQSNFVADKMLELPYDLMSKVVLNADKNVDDTIDTAVSLYDKLDANSLVADTPRLREIVQGYEGQVDDLVSEIQKNPLEYSRKLGDIRNLGRQIRSDFGTGEVAAIEKRFNEDAQWWKDAKELQKKDPQLYTDDYLRRLRRRNLEESGTVSYKGNNDYTPYSANSVHGLGNLNEWVDERLKDAIPDAQSVERDVNSGGWIVTTKEGTKTMTAGELNDILTNSFNADTELQRAILQREELGMDGFNGISTDGNINPISSIRDVEMVDDKGNVVKVPTLGFSDNILGSAFRAGVEKFGFESTESSERIKASPFALKNQELENKKKYKEWEDNKQDDFVQYVSNSTLNSVAGGNIEEYNQNILFTQKKMQNIKDDAREIVKRELGLGMDTNLPLEAEVAIEKGNFSYLYSLKNPDGTPMFESGTIAKLEDGYKEERLNMSAIQAIRSDWEREKEKEYNNRSPQGLTLEEYVQQQEPDFNRYLNETEKISVPQKFTWEGTGVTPKEAASFSKRIVESGMYRLYNIDFPQGATATDKNGREVDISNMSLDQMLRKGIVEREPVKIPYEHVTPGLKNKEGLQITPDEYEVRYKMVDGSGYIGFSVSPESIAPATSYDDDRKLELGMIVDFRGEKRIAKIDDITSTKLKGFENVNSDMLRTNYYLTKISNASEVTIPGGQGVKVKNVRNSDGSLKRQELLIPNGQGGYITESLDDPRMKGLLNTIINK